MNKSIVSTMKTVHFEEVKDAMEQMLIAPIFETQEKRMLADISKKMQLDPNMVMDVRHEIFHEPLPISTSKNLILQEAKRLVMDEETRALYRKREEEMLEAELKRFQSQLRKNRPKFRGPYACSRKILTASDDAKFWTGVSGIGAKKDADKLFDRDNGAVQMREVVADREKKYKTDSETMSSCNLYDPCPIVVTIKDKPITESREDQLELMKSVFRSLRRNVVQQKQLRELKVKVQERITRQRLRQTFNTWRRFVSSARTKAQEKKEGKELTKERKIELFVNAIAERQKELAKSRGKTDKSVSVDVGKTSIRNGETLPPVLQVTANNADAIKKKNISDGKIVNVVEPPAQNRLNAQRKIIAEQKAKLAEQNRIIEDLKLRQIEKETRLAGKETVDVAKEILVNCGGRTRRTLVKLMREEGCKDGTIIEPPRLPSPPKFLMRMEARAEARRERVKRAQEERERKMEEKRRKEEIQRRAEDEERKRLQLEAQKEARRMREEQEQRRAREAERTKHLNEIADEYRRKYLLRRYMMEPFFRLIEMKYNYTRMADEHYQKSLLRRILNIWMTETRESIAVKVELATEVYDRNLTWYVFGNWREFAKSEAKKMQVAADFYDLRLQTKCLRIWNGKTIESKVRYLDDEQLAREHYGKRLRRKFFARWKDYPRVSRSLKEKEKRKDKWRELVQRVVPDFDPKQRGVAIED